MTDHPTFWDSIRWRAAFLTSALVAVVLTAFIWFTFGRVTRDLITGGAQRAQTAATVLAAQSGQSTQQGLARIDDIARDPAIRAYLLSPGPATEAAARSALMRADLPGQEGMTELWDDSGQLKLKMVTPADAAGTFPSDRRPAAAGLLPLEAYGQNVFTRAIADVPGTSSSAHLGSVDLIRLIRSASASRFKDVVGNGAIVLVGNQDTRAGAVWTDLQEAVAAPAIDLTVPGGREFRSGTGEAEIGAFALIPGTPWVLLVEFPRNVVLAPAWQLLRRLIAAGVLFLVVATLAASTLSRRVTQPLGDLTLAAQALQRGDFGRRVIASRRDELGQLGRAFNAMAQQIESGRRSLELRASELAASRALADQANQAKDDFLAVLSHELRTPLSAMLGWCHLLRSGSLPAEAHDRAIEVIERNAVTQLRLVNDLLDISRIVVGKFVVDLQPADAVAVARAAVDSNQPAADRRRISLSCDVDAASQRALAAVIVDPDRLQQAVDNLVGNAIKFTPPGGTVHVFVSALEGQFEIAVKDNGEGISPDALAQIFDRLRQAENGARRRHAGLGLGLAIVRQIVELHHGTVSAESPGIGHGSTFRIQLPMRTASTASSESSRGQAGASVTQKEKHGDASIAGVRILVVEDVDDSREFLQQLLTKSGAVVAVAPRAAAAIRWLQDHRTDVIVSDIEMPEQDGLAMMRAIRAGAAPGAQKVPAIALSAYASPQDRSRSLSAGYQVHLTKPVVVDELLTTLTAIVSRDQESYAVPPPVTQADVRS